MPVHQAAQSGFTKASDTYVAGRPGYPAQIDGWLKDTLVISAGMQVVDLGAGTGKFTKHLIGSGAHVIAVEPVEAMLDQLRQSHPAVRAVEGAATSIPLESASVDAVFCAQSFHWFASMEAVEEIRRVLKPGGIMALVWNVRDETCDWVAELSRIMAPYEEGTPRFHHGHWRSVFPADGFAPLQEMTFEHNHRGEFQSVVLDRILSVSFIAALPQSERDTVECQIRDLVNLFSGLGDESDVSFPYQTFVTWTIKI